MEPPILRSPPPRTLDALTAYEDQGVREAVARHPATPAVALEAMAGELDRLRDLRIARALAGRPSFMLLDEPFAGIDPLAIADIRTVIRYLASQGIGVLITDHNVRETLDITDRVSIISNGAVLFEGTSDEAIHDAEVRRVYLGENYV